MSFLDNITARIPFAKKEQNLEYFFALNIDQEKVTAAVWTIDSGKLSIINSAETSYTTQEQLLPAADKVLDIALGDFNVEPDKILFGVPDSWLQEDNLKESYLNLLRKIVKELELKPMAYVSTTQALSHFLENTEGAPTTAILIGVEKVNVAVSVIRAGKLDGTKVVARGDNLGIDIEKGLISFSEVEVLPSKILVYGEGDLEKIKSELLSFSWMQKLSFLHFPKISVLEDNIDVKAISFAGAVEQNPHVKYHPQVLNTNTATSKQSLLEEEPVEKILTEKPIVVKKEMKEEEDLGFVSGDVTSKKILKEEVDLDLIKEKEFNEDNLEEGPPAGGGEPNITFEQEEEIREDRKPILPVETEIVAANGIGGVVSRIKAPFANLPNPLTKSKGPLLIPLVFLILLLGGYLAFYKATVKIFVEPRVLENNIQVIADPTVKEVDEENKKIPGEIVQTSASSSDKGTATGKKQIGDPAKGTVTIYNKTSGRVSLPSGTVLSASGQKFALENSVNIASQSATDSGITFGKATTNVTASTIGADSNLPSGTELTVTGQTADKVSAKAEGNFSGGTSKEVTVVTDEDQKKLLALVSSNLRKTAQQELQGKLEGKKILEEALQEEITKRSYSKNINDQASEFSLNLTAKYKGTAYSDADLRTIVSKLVSTSVPDDFQLDLAETETQADVSKVEKDGKLIFLAKFKAKLMPRIDTEKVKSQISGKGITHAENILKGFDNVLDSEIKTNLPLIPQNFLWLPLIPQNIILQTGLK